MTQARFKAAIEDTRAATEKAVTLDKTLAEYLRESSRPPKG